MKDTQPRKATFFWRVFPLIGSTLFLLLYVIATFYYPGGTHSNKSAKGFSWTQNYWCNLLSENAINGQQNPARPIAFTAMIVLSITLIVFWYWFPIRAGFKAKERYIIQASGFISMVIGLFVFTSLHDAIINIAGAFGLIALGGTLIGLKRLHWTRLFYMGLFLVLLIGLNNFLYYEKNFMRYLAVVQKITFLSFLVWICCITYVSSSKPTEAESF